MCLSYPDYLMLGWTVSVGSSTVHYKGGAVCASAGRTSDFIVVL